jgi:hypothetical protein
MNETDARSLIDKVENDNPNEIGMLYEGEFSRHI